MEQDRGSDKQQMTIRLSAEGRRLLVELARRQGISRTAVLELLIRQERGPEAREILDVYSDLQLETNAMLTLDRTKLLLEAQSMMREGDFTQAIASLRSVRTAWSSISARPRSVRTTSP